MDGTKILTLWKPFSTVWIRKAPDHPCNIFHMECTEILTVLAESEHMKNYVINVNRFWDSVIFHMDGTKILTLWKASSTVRKAPDHPCNIFHMERTEILTVPAESEHIKLKLTEHFAQSFRAGLWRYHARNLKAQNYSQHCVCSLSLVSMFWSYGSWPSRNTEYDDQWSVNCSILIIWKSIDSLCTCFVAWLQLASMKMLVFQLQAFWKLEARGRAWVKSLDACQRSSKLEMKFNRLMS